MRERLRCDQGQVAIVVVFFMTFLLIVAGLVIDAGGAKVLHRKAQADADAVALASVWGLTGGPQAVQQLAQQYMALNASAGIDAPPVVTETTADAPNDSVSVSISGQYRTVFLRLAGVNTIAVKATAQATLHSVRGCDATGCYAAPWGLPDCDMSSGTLDCSRPFSAGLGDEVVLKSDQSAGGKFYALQMPVVKAGTCSSPKGSDYSHTITSHWGSGGLLSCNVETAGPASSGYSTAGCDNRDNTSVASCVLRAKTGNIVGPTRKGLTSRLGCSSGGDCNSDSLAYITGGCDPATAFDHFCPVVHDSPRLIVVPIVRNLDNSAGYQNCASGANCYVKIVDLVYFYIDATYGEITGSNEVRGTFFRSTAPPTFDLIGPYDGGAFFDVALTK